MPPAPTFRTGRVRRRSLGRLIDHPWAVIVALALIPFALWVRSTRTSDHQLRAVFDDAVSVYKGLDVRIAGLDAGKVQGVKREGGHAVVTLGINNGNWPLHAGTTAALRFGTTVGNGTRLVDVKPGPTTAPALPENGIITREQTITPTEFDDLFDTFNASTRRHIKGMAGGMATTFGPRAAQLASDVKQAARGLDAVGGLASDLARDEPALRAAVANTDRVTETLAVRSPELADLVTVAGRTFETFARNTSGITDSLDRLPAALHETRSTLARLDGSVGHLDGLVADLGPGARQLTPLARELRPALTGLRHTVPDAVRAFRAGRDAAPDVTALLRLVPSFADVAAPDFARLAPMVACIRPYAPEIAALMSTWSSFTKGYDGEGHIGRIWANAGPTSLTATPNVGTDTFTKLTGQGYALVRPPGYNAGKPVFLPECGAGPDGVNPAKDPEHR